MADDLSEFSPEMQESFAQSQQPTADRAPATVSQDAPAEGTEDEYAGFSPEMQQSFKEEKYGTPTEMLKTGAEGLAKGIAGPLATGLESALFGNEKEQLARAETNPITHGAGEVTGLVGGAMTGTGLGGALGKIGEVAEAATAARGLGKIGSSIVKSAIENLVYQGSDETSKLILRDPNQSAETAAADMGLAALVGGAFGTISPLWHATAGRDVGGVLGALSDKLGGIETADGTAIDKAINRSGVNVPPETRTLLSDNPEVQEMARGLMQTDNSSGLAKQQAYKEMTRDASSKLVESLGRTPEEVATMSEVSEHETGKALGKTLAKEYEAQINPLSETFEELKGKFKNVELDQPMTLEGGIKVPGTTDAIAEKIAQKAIDEGWVTSPSSDIMREVKRVAEELPLQKNLKNLGDFITQVGNNTNKDIMNGPLKRAGGIITGILKEAEGDIIAKKLGEREGPAAVEAFKAAREGYAVQSAMKEALDSRLGIGGSTSGYANALRTMAREDGEGVLRRLSGKGDAEALDFLSKHYPETAQVLRNYHIADLLEKSAAKAKDGHVVDNATFLKLAEKMTPELRNFVASPEAQQNIQAIGGLLDMFKNPNQNFSNTARAFESKAQGIAGGALGTAMGLTGHGFVKSALAIPLVKALGKDIPDAIRLGLLKFLGSNQEISPSAFKSMVEYINHTRKGETALSNGIKNIFKAGSEVIPPRLLPTDKDRDKINKAVDQMKQDPNRMLGVAGNMGHYMDEHATALTQTAANAVNFINSQRPNIGKASPFDTQRVANAYEKAQYNRTLDIAQQPLIVLKHIAEGRLTPADVSAQRTMYPALYNRTVEKLTDQLANASAKGHTIPYKTRMGISMYLGQAQDSTMQPQSILAAQPKPPQSQPQTATQPASNPKRSTASLSKMPKMYQTNTQSAAEDRQKRE